MLPEILFCEMNMHLLYFIVKFLKPNQHSSPKERNKNESRTDPRLLAFSLTSEIFSAPPATLKMPPVPDVDEDP